MEEVNLKDALSGLENSIKEKMEASIKEKLDEINLNIDEKLNQMSVSLATSGNKEKATESVDDFYLALSDSLKRAEQSNGGEINLADLPVTDMNVSVNPKGLLLKPSNKLAKLLYSQILQSGSNILGLCDTVVTTTAQNDYAFPYYKRGAKVYRKKEAESVKTSSFEADKISITWEYAASMIYWTREFIRRMEDASEIQTRWITESRSGMEQIIAEDLFFAGYDPTIPYEDRSKVGIYKHLESNGNILETATAGKVTINDIDKLVLTASETVVGTRLDFQDAETGGYVLLVSSGIAAMMTRENRLTANADAQLINPSIFEYFRAKGGEFVGMYNMQLPVVVARDIAPNRASGEFVRTQLLTKIDETGNIWEGFDNGQMPFCAMIANFKTGSTIFRATNIDQIIDTTSLHAQNAIGGSMHYAYSTAITDPHNQSFFGLKVKDYATRVAEVGKKTKAMKTAKQISETQGE